MPNPRTLQRRAQRLRKKQRRSGGGNIRLEQANEILMNIYRPGIIEMFNRSMILERFLRE